jgi:hypothetical protein
VVAVLPVFERSGDVGLRPCQFLEKLGKPFLEKVDAVVEVEQPYRVFIFEQMKRRVAVPAKVEAGIVANDDP